MTTPYCMVLCTCPSHEVASSIARHITEAKLAACTNIIPHLTSVYFWEGEVKEGKEVLMMIKTKKDKLTELEEAILSLHPYEFPEFIAFPIIYGNTHYLKWLDDVVS